MEPTTSFAIALGVYVALLFGVGFMATRKSSSSSEEFFLAGRGLKTVVLFMALFGTNCTAFVLVGIPGQAYHDGIGVFSINAPIVALGIPLTFWAIGGPARRLAKKYGALTPAELYARRFNSRAVGIVLFTFFTLYTLPYMVTALRGAAVTLSVVTEGAIPEWIAGAGVLIVALAYTSLGGMRATAYTNVVQGVLFLGFMVAAFFVIGNGVGGDEGIPGAMRKVAAHNPDLLGVKTTGLYSPSAWTSWGLALSLTVVAFPHMLVRLMAADSDKSLKNICRLYPLALIALWTPAVMIGVWGAAAFPGLVGRESDKIFSLMVTNYLPPALAALGFLAVLAAVMSTLDAQILTLGSMLSRDVMKPSSNNQTDIRRGRIFGLFICAAVYLLWQSIGQSIFALALVSFSGYVTLTPTLFLGLRWKRFNATGAITSILTANALYFLAMHHAGSITSAMSPSWLGFLPVMWGFLGGIAGALIGTFLSSTNETVCE
jgi:SSS family solute:Na+ symporter